MNRIKYLRLLKEMTQEEFAEFCDISRASIARYDSGGRVDRTNAEKIASACGVSVDYVLGIDDNPQDYQSAHKQPRTVEAQIISAGVDKMSPENRRIALNLLKAVYADCFEPAEEDKIS